MNLNRILPVAALLVLCPFVIAGGCTGSRGDSNYDATVDHSGNGEPTGGAAIVVTGAALVGADVLAINANGLDSGGAVTATDGTYDITLTGNGPYIFRASGGWKDLDHDGVRDAGEPDNTMVYYAVGNGPVNISQLTTVVVCRAMELGATWRDLGTLFANPDTTTLNSIMTFRAAANFDVGGIVGLNGVDLHTEQFVADGTGVDGVHDNFSIVSAPGQVTLLDNAGNPVGVFGNQN